MIDHIYSLAPKFRAKKRPTDRDSAPQKKTTMVLLIELVDIDKDLRSLKTTF